MRRPTSATRPASASNSRRNRSPSFARRRSSATAPARSTMLFERVGRRQDRRRRRRRPPTRTIRPSRSPSSSAWSARSCFGRCGSRTCCLFRGAGLADWIGLVVVVQNIVGSLFNSHLFDFVQGWVYVVGVGVAGGMVLKQERTTGSSGAGAMSAVEPHRASGAAAHSGRCAAPARRRAADDAADPQPAAGLAGGDDRRLGVRRHRRHSRRAIPISMASSPCRRGRARRRASRSPRGCWRKYDLAISTQCGDRPTFFALVAGRRCVAPVEATLQRPPQARVASSQRSLCERRASGRGDAAACRCARHCARAGAGVLRSARADSACPAAIMR